MRGAICPDPPGRGRSGGPAAGGSRPLRSARSRLKPLLQGVAKRWVSGRRARLPAVPALGNLLDQLGAERGQVLGRAAGDQAFVHHHFLVHPRRAGALEVAADVRHRGDGAAVEHVGIGQHPGPVADRAHRLARGEEAADEGQRAFVGAQGVGVEQAARHDQRVVVAGIGIVEADVDLHLAGLVEMFEALQGAVPGRHHVDRGALRLQRLQRLEQLGLLEAVGGAARDVLAFRLAHRTAPGGGWSAAAEATRRSAGAKETCTAGQGAGHAPRRPGAVHRRPGVYAAASAFRRVLAKVTTTLFRSALATMLALAALVLVNLAGARVSDAIPALAGDARLAADLAWRWLGGLAAAWLAAALAPVAKGLHVLVLFAAVGVVAIRWALGAWGDFPAWFTIGVLAGLPLQAGAGAWLERTRRRGA